MIETGSIRGGPARRRPWRSMGRTACRAVVAWVSHLSSSVRITSQICAGRGGCSGRRHGGVPAAVDEPPPFQAPAPFDEVPPPASQLYGDADGYGGDAGGYDGDGRGYSDAGGAGAYTYAGGDGAGHIRMTATCRRRRAAVSLRCECRRRSGSVTERRGHQTRTWRLTFQWRRRGCRRRHLLHRGVVATVARRSRRQCRARPARSSAAATRGRLLRRRF